jgi:hypothetical protein
MLSSLIILLLPIQIHISTTILSSVAHSLPYYSLLFFLFFFLSKQHTKRPYCPSSSSSKKKGVNNLKDKDKDKDKDKEKDEIPTDEAGNTPCFLFMDSSSYHAAKRITDNLRL